MKQYKLEQFWEFAFQTQNPSTGAAVDADSLPTYRVYEENNSVVIGTGDCLKRDDTNTIGYYYARGLCASASGFETGKNYDVRVEATVSAASGAGLIGNFEVVPVTVWDSMFGGTDNLEVDAVQISGDGTAADSLELQFDGTGVTGDTYPARQDQVDTIAVTGSAINEPAESFTLTSGAQTGTFSDTVARDTDYHLLQDLAAGGIIDGYYQFDVGADGVPVTCQIFGRANGLNDPIGIYGWDWTGVGSWVQVFTLPGTNLATDISYTFGLYTNMVGTGVNLGKVRIRLYNTGLSSPSTRINQIYVSYAVVRRTIGYEGGAIWIDTVNGNAGTTTFTNGTADNPVSTLADALTLAAALKIYKLYIANGSSITLAASADNYDFNGRGWTLALGGQSISASVITGAIVTGTATGVITPHFYDCDFGNGSADLSLPAHIATNCRMHVTGSYAVTVGSGVTIWERCCSAVAGNVTPRMIFSTDTDFNVRGYYGGLQFESMGASNLASYDCPAGQLKLAASCTGGIIRRAGFQRLTDSSGLVTITDGYGMTISTDADEKVTLISAYDAAKTAAQAGDAMTLTVGYDAAKTAAQAGDAMTLIAGYDAAKTASQVGDAMTLTVGYDAAKTASQAGDAMTLTVGYDAAKTASQVGDAMTLTVGYDAAKTAAQAGDAMTLTVGYDAAKTAAQAGDAMTLIAGYDAAKTAAQAGDAMTLIAGYDAAKTAAQAGDAMTLIAGYDAAKTAAQAGDAMTLIAGYDAAKTAAQAGDAMTLTVGYDAAKTASQAGDEMDLVDSPNSKAIALIKVGAPKVVASADGKTLTLKTAGDVTIATLTTADSLTWTLTVV